MMFNKRNKKPMLFLQAGKEFKYTFQLLDECETDEDKINAIDLFTDLIINDLKYYMALNVIYNDQVNCESVLGYLFPTESWDRDGKPLMCEESNEAAMEIDIQKDRVIVAPWCKKRYIRAMKKNKYREFKFMPNNHFGIYYKPLDICHIYNGNHSIATFIGYKKTGKIKVNEIDISSLFNLIDTDGKYWNHKYNNEVKAEVRDYRLALIFKLNKIKYEILEKRS